MLNLPTSLGDGSHLEQSEDVMNPIDVERTAHSDGNVDAPLFVAVSPSTVQTEIEGITSMESSERQISVADTTLEDAAEAIKSTPDHLPPEDDLTPKPAIGEQLHTAQASTTATLEEDEVTSNGTILEYEPGSDEFDTQDLTDEGFNALVDNRILLPMTMSSTLNDCLEPSIVPLKPVAHTSTCEPFLGKLLNLSMRLHVS